MKLKGFRRAATLVDDQTPKAALTSRNTITFEGSDLKFPKRYDTESPNPLNPNEGTPRKTNTNLGGGDHSKLNSRKCVQMITAMNSRKSLQIANINNLPAEESKNLIPRTKTETA